MFSAIASLIPSAFQGVIDIIKKNVPDSDKQNEIIHSLAMANLAINNTEAQHKSLFVAGWRPYIGWMCGVALTYQWLISPILHQVFGFPPAELDLSNVIAILSGMLGIAGLRTYEKRTGVSR